MRVIIASVFLVMVGWCYCQAAFALEEVSSLERFWWLKTLEGSDDEVKHIEFTIELEQGTVVFIADKLKKDVVNIEVVSETNVMLTQTDMDKLDDEIARVKDRLDDNRRKRKRLIFALKFLEYVRWAYPGHYLNPRNNTYTVENVYDDDDISALIQQRLKQSLSSLDSDGTQATPRPTAKPTFQVIQGTLLTKKPTKAPTRAPTRAPTWRCGDQFLSTWDSSPYSGAPCPKYSAVGVPNRKSKIICLCPYNGVNGATALFDGFNKFGQKKTLSWKVKYGSATPQCIGRCGPGCNSWDQEATLDCLAHDLCINFFGGPTTFFNPNCNNEVDNGLDDVAATLFSVCC